MDEGDVRLGGLVFQSHHISVNRGGEYDDEIDTLEAAAEALVTDVLTDFETSPAYDMEQTFVGYDSDDDDDDDKEER